ncbi:MAG: tandem-95 repeat protein [Anaerolineae bacterium]
MIIFFTLGPRTFAQDSPPQQEQTTDPSVGTPVEANPSVIDIPTDTPTSPPSDTPTPIPPPTDTSTPINTPIPVIPPETVLIQSVYEPFDQVDPAHWSLGSGWSFDLTDSGTGLKAVDTVEQASWVGTPLDDAAIQFRYMSGGAGWWFYAHESGTDRYTAGIAPDGTVLITRSGVLLSSAIVAVDTIPIWHTVRFSIVDGVIRLSIDTFPMLTVVDPSPLPGGRFGFAPSSSRPEALYIDDVSIAVPVDQAVEINETTAPTATLDLPIATLPPPPTDIPIAESPGGFQPDMLAVTNASSGSITVTTTAQEYPPQMNGNCTLSEAIIAANTNAAVDACAAGSASSTDVIDLPTGTYVIASIAIEDFATSDRTGLPYITSDIVINGHGSTIDRQGYAMRLIRVMDSGQLTVNDLTLSHGTTSSSNFAGGAIHSAGALTLNNVTVRHSSIGMSAPWLYGEAIALIGTAPLTINGGSFESNGESSVSHYPSMGYTVSAGTGAIHVNGAMFTNDRRGAIIGTTVSISNSTFTNTLTHAVTGTYVTITDSTFTNLSGPSGAAVWVSSGTLTMSNTLITGTTIDSMGGAVYLLGSTGTITNTRVLGTVSAVSPLHGDGIYVQDDINPNPDISSSLTISGSCLVGNEAYGIRDNASGVVNATGNWWGATDGPSGIGSGGGDALLGNPIYQPFLTTDPGSCGSLPPIARNAAAVVFYETPFPFTPTIIGGIPPYTVNVVTPTAHGTVSGTLPVLTYNPNNGYIGTDSFIYTVTDSTGKFSNSAMVTFTITSNLTVLPVVELSTYTFPLDFTLTASNGILPLTFTLITPPLHGTISGASPNFTFTPDATFFSTDEMQFRVTDAAGFFQNFHVHVNQYNPVAAPPIVRNITRNVMTLVAGIATGGIPPLTFAYSTPQYGTISNPSSSTFQFNYTYTAAATVPEVITVTITAQGGSSVDTQVILIPDSPIVANEFTLQTPHDRPVDGTLSGSGGVEPYTYTIVLPPQHGTLSGTLPNFTYTPDSGYKGTDSFLYLLTDANNISATGHIYMYLADDVGLYSPALPLRVGYETPLQFSETVTGGIPVTYTFSLTTPPQHGTVTGLLDTPFPATQPTQQFIYTPNAGYSGTDSFELTISDGVGDTYSQTLTVSITAPITVAAGDVNGLIAAIVAANTAPGPDLILLSGGTYTLTDQYFEADPDVQTATAHSNGLPVINDTLEIRGISSNVIIERAANTVPFRILMNWASNSVIAHLTLRGGITLNLIPINSNPVEWSGGNIYNTGSLTLIDVTISGGRAYLGGGIYNNMGASLTLQNGRIIGDTAVNKGGGIYNAGVVNAQNSVFALSSLGNENIEGSQIANIGTGARVDVLTSCMIGLPQGQMAVVANTFSSGSVLDHIWWGNPDGPLGMIGLGVTITNNETTPLFECPGAANQSIGVAYQTARNVTLTGTGSAPLTYSIATAPLHGTLSGTTSAITYTPNAGYSGADSFIYRVTDANGLFADGLISLTVQPELVAIEQAVSVTTNGTQAITLAATGGVSGSYVFNITVPPGHGTLSGAAPDLIYTPTPNYTGSDNIVFTVTDSNGDTDTATVTIAVSMLSTTGQSLATAYGTLLPISLSASGGTTPYLFLISAQPMHGTVTQNGANVTYVPNTGYSGEDSFTYRVTDSVGAQVTDTITIIVGAASSTTINVNSTAHEVPFLTNGNCTLGEAITAANTNTAVDSCPAGNGADVIVVPAGTYTLTSYYYPATKDGLPNIVSPITIRGAGIGQTIFQPATAVTSMVLFTNLSTFTMQGMTIRGFQVGRVSNPASSITNYADLVVNGVRFESNSGWYGGAIYSGIATWILNAPTPSVRIYNSEFINNAAIGLMGGALYGMNGATLEVYNSLFQQNNAQLDGATIWWSGTATMQGNCLLDVPTSGHALGFNPSIMPPTPATMNARLNWWGVSGIAISALNADTAPTLSIRPAICGTFTPPPLNIPAGNVNALIAALQYANTQTGPTTITLAADSTYSLTQALSIPQTGGFALLPAISSNVVLQGNHATLTRTGTEEQSMLVVLKMGTLTVQDLTFTNGRAPFGSAISVLGGRLTVTGSHFTGNGTADTLSGRGGAIGMGMYDGINAVVTISGSTFERNRAQYGGALYVSAASLTLQNNQFIGNQASTGSSVYSVDGQHVETAAYNCFVQNSSSSAARVNQLGNNAALPFANNWWGTVSGPSGAGSGTGDSVSPNVDYSPFLTSPPSGCSTYLSTNTAPISTGYGQAISFTLSAIGGQTPYTFTVTRNPQHGMLSGTAPNLTYTPNANFSGVDSLDFSVIDSRGIQVSASLSITVSAPPNPTPPPRYPSRFDRLV